MCPGTHGHIDFDIPPLAAPIRAAPFVFLGTAILDLTLAQSLMIAGVLFVIFAAPLLHPKVRSWVWG